MFRLAVTSSALHCVTDAEDTQLAAGRAGEGGDVKQTCRVFVCVCVCVLVFLCVQPYQSCSPIYTSTSTCLCPNLDLAAFSAGRPARCERSMRGPAPSVLIRQRHVWIVRFRNTSVSALRLLSVKMDPLIYLQNSPPSLCLKLSPSSANNEHLGKRRKTGKWTDHGSVS